MDGPIYIVEAGQGEAMSPVHDNGPAETSGPDNAVASLSVSVSRYTGVACHMSRLSMRTLYIRTSPSVQREDWL